MAKMNPPVLKHDPFCQVHLLPIHSKKAMRSWVFELHSWIEMQTASCQLQSSGIRRPGTDIAAEIRTLLPPQKSWGLFQLNAYRIRGSRWISFSARPLELSAPHSMSYVLRSPERRKTILKRTLPHSVARTSLGRLAKGRRGGQLKQSEAHQRLWNSLKKFRRGNKSNKLRNVTQLPRPPFPA